MSTRCALALVLVILWLWPASLHAQSEALMEAYRQGQTLYDAGRYEQAIPLWQKALELSERQFGPDHPTTALLLNNLAELYRAQGRYADAEPLFNRALAIKEMALGPDHPDVAQSLNNLALLYGAQGRYEAAEPLFNRALAIDEKALGPDHPNVATSLNNLAALYDDQGLYVAAEPLYKRALAIYEKALGPDHPNVAVSLNNLAALYKNQGRYAAAEPLYKRALAIHEKTLGPDHPSVATSLNNLALLYGAQGLYEAAEPLYKRALTIDEKALGADHLSVATSLNNLALLYGTQGRYKAAEPLYQRALAIHEKTLGPDHPTTATLLNNFAELYRAQGRYEAAEPLYKRALAVWEKALGPEHPNVATILNNLALLYGAQGLYEAAEPLYKRVLAIDEKVLGPEHPSVATSLNNLAGLYRAQGRYEAAEPLLNRALAINEKALGLDHPNVATSLNNIAALYDEQGRYEAALDYIRRATAIHRSRAERAGTTRSAGALKEQASNRYVFLRHADILETIIEKQPKRRPELLAEAFEVGQLAQASSAAGAVARMGARFAAGDDALAGTVRAYQDAVEQWQRLDARLVQAVSKPPEKRDGEAEAKLRDDLAALDARIGALGERLAEDFPEFAELANPKPLSLSETQALLGPAEALMTYLVSDDRTFLWVIRRDDAAFYKLDIGRLDLEDAVTFIRGGLDRAGSIPIFDVEEALALYRKIFAPAEAMLEGARHVFVVPDGALQSLPLGVLVTEEPENWARRPKLSAYGDVEWLARKYAMTVLPSVSSLRALRLFAKSARASRPFIGFGDPELDGGDAVGRGVDVAALFTRGAVADVDAVRELARLPETADELYALAAAQGVGEETVYLQARATETRVRSMDLSDYRVLAFATHGLVSGELSGLAEPALVFTPPETGTEADDGLLTASEIATLDLDADWVILSACNTAAADGTPGAEGLSGLAKAFFYAGARALLVSHWAVNSEAAVAITTGMLGEMADNPAIGRAEALRRSMLAMMETEGKDHFAHPMFWAPFVVVGEGGRPM